MEISEESPPQNLSVKLIALFPENFSCFAPIVSNIAPNMGLTDREACLDLRARCLRLVAALRARGDLTTDHPAIRAVGYRQLWASFDGEFALDEAVRRGIFATRQLAKRQLTWLRSTLELTSINPHEGGAFERWSAQVRAGVAAERDKC